MDYIQYMYNLPSGSSCDAVRFILHAVEED